MNLSRIRYIGQQISAAFGLLLVAIAYLAAHVFFGVCELLGVDDA